MDDRDKKDENMLNSVLWSSFAEMEILLNYWVHKVSTKPMYAIYSPSYNSILPNR